jgi:hypothetical protein
MPQDKKPIQEPKRNCRNNKQVYRRDGISMIAKEGLPALRRWPPSLCHVFCYCPLPIPPRWSDHAAAQGLSLQDLPRRPPAPHHFRRPQAAYDRAAEGRPPTKGFAQSREGKTQSGRVTGQTRPSRDGGGAQGNHDDRQEPRRRHRGPEGQGHDQDRPGFGGEPRTLVQKRGTRTGHFSRSHPGRSGQGDVVRTRIVVVDPAQTSQRCSACQTVDAASRISRSRIVYTNCGSMFDADINARRTSSPSASAQPEDFRRWPVNRAGLPAGSRKKTPARAEAQPFRAESSQSPVRTLRCVRHRDYR